MNLLRIACLVILLPTISLAKSERVQCLVGGHDSGWIADQIFFEFDEKQASARVSDDIILHFQGKPMPAEILENTSKKLVLTWRVIARSRSQTTKMTYRLSYLRGNNRVVVSAKPHGYADNFTARGRCQKINQEIPTT